MNFIWICIIVSAWKTAAFFARSTSRKTVQYVSITETFELPMDDGEVSWDTDADIRLRRLREYLRLNNITCSCHEKKTFWDDPNQVSFLFI
jgi:hypothetical protein